tara:strand:- start:106773 stop:108773 length:2001 start_codon:yes stop_codon:yes gene_type:complete
MATQPTHRVLHYQQVIDSLRPGKYQVVEVVPSTGTNLGVRLRVLATGEEVLRKNLMKVIKNLRDSPTYEIRTPSASKTSVKEIPTSDEERNRAVTRLQAKTDALKPSTYQVLDLNKKTARISTEGKVLKTTYHFTIVDINRDCEFTYSGPAFIRELKKNPDRLFSPTSEERSSLTKKAFIDKGLTTIVEGQPIDEWAAANGISNTYARALVANCGTAKVPDLVRGTGTVIENVVSQLLTDLGVPYIHNKELPGSTLRPDFLVPGYDVVIECDGLYFHSEATGKGRNHHLHRRREFEALGYRPLFFRSDEITFRTEAVRSILGHAVGKSTTTGARKCTIVPGSAEFFDTHHLMGRGSGQVFSLSYRGETLCAMQVRWVQVGELLDISRFCTRGGHAVPGGWSRLLRHVINHYDPAMIQTFVDRRYGDGSHLEAQGWTKVSEYPSFKWTNGTETLHRMKYPGSSGVDAGYTRIWDCGQAKWTLELRETSSLPPSSPEEAPPLTRRDNSRAELPLPGKEVRQAKVVKANQRLTKMGLDSILEVQEAIPSRTKTSGRMFWTLRVRDKRTNDEFTRVLGGFFGKCKKYGPEVTFFEKKDPVSAAQSRVDSLGLGHRFEVLQALEKVEGNNTTSHRLLVLDREGQFQFEVDSHRFIYFLRQNPDHRFRATSR